MEFEYYQDKEGNAYELKTNLEKLLVHEIFEQDKEIERLKTELQETKEHLGEYLHEQEEENKRINNIINELKERSLLYSKEIDRLLTIKEEVREYIENAFATGEEIFKVEILEILDKEVN